MIRFWKRKQVAPGVTINISKGGLSTSIGTRGAHVTIGRGTRVTAGIPGSGVSVTKQVTRRRKRSHTTLAAALIGFGIGRAIIRRGR